MDYGYPQFTEAQILAEFIKTDAHKMEVRPAGRRSTQGPTAAAAALLRLGGRSGQAAHAGACAQVQARPPMAVTNAVSWRSEGIRHKKNEVFLDVVESVNLLVNSNGAIVRSEVTGALKMRTALSGMPECKLGLNDKVRDTAVAGPPHQQPVLCAANPAAWQPAGSRGSACRAIAASASGRGPGARRCCSSRRASPSMSRRRRWSWRTSSSTSASASRASRPTAPSPSSRRTAPLTSWRAPAAHAAAGRAGAHNPGPGMGRFWQPGAPAALHAVHRDCYGSPADAWACACADVQAEPGHQAAHLGGVHGGETQPQQDGLPGQGALPVQGAQHGHLGAPPAASDVRLSSWPPVAGKAEWRGPPGGGLPDAVYVCAGRDLRAPATRRDRPHPSHITGAMHCRARGAPAGHHACGGGSERRPAAQGSAVYVPEKDAMCWRIKNFPGGREFPHALQICAALCGCRGGACGEVRRRQALHALALPCGLDLQAHSCRLCRMPPLRVQFEIPYLTVSGIQVSLADSAASSQMLPRRCGLQLACTPC